MFTKKLYRLPNGVRVRIPRHYQYGYFGVRGRYDTVSCTGVYVNNKQPGTGFFVHGMDSRSYRHFVHDEKKKLHQNFWTLLFGREPNIGKEIRRVDKWLATQQGDTVQKQIVVQYLNVLRLAQEEQQYQRIVRDLKDKLDHRRTGKNVAYYTSILSNYKSRIATLQHDVKGAQFNIKEMLSPQSLAAWQQVVEAFIEIVEARRVWQVVNGRAYEQAFFDLGIFDYIQSPFDTPMLRDAKGGLYFLLPQGVVRYRTNIDFDFIPLKEISFEAGSLDLNAVTGALETSGRQRRQAGRSDALGQLYATTRGINAVGELRCPALGLTFCCNHLSPLRKFAEAFDAFKKLDNPLDFNTLHSNRGGGVLSVKEKAAQTTGGIISNPLQ